MATLNNVGVQLQLRLIGVNYYSATYNGLINEVLYNMPEGASPIKYSDSRSINNGFADFRFSLFVDIGKQKVHFAIRILDVVLH